MTASSILVGTSIFAITACLSAALVTMPRWLFRPLVLHRLWTLRDEIVLDVIRGDLPKAPRVAWVLHRIEGSLANSKHMSLLSLLLLGRSVRRIPTDSYTHFQKRHAEPSTSGMTPEQVRRLNVYRDRERHLVIAQVSFSTWIGVLFTVLVTPVLIFMVLIKITDTRSKDIVANRADDYFTFHDEGGNSPLLAA